MWLVDGVKCQGLLPQKGYPRCGKGDVFLCMLPYGGLWVCRQCYEGEMGVSMYERQEREAAALSDKRAAARHVANLRFLGDVN